MCVGQWNTQVTRSALVYQWNPMGSGPHLCPIPNVSSSSLVDAWHKCQESGQPSLLVMVELCLFHVVIEVCLYCLGCNWHFWSYGYMANVSPLALPWSPLTGWYVSLKKIPNPQPLDALLYSGTQLHFSLFVAGYHQRLQAVPKFTTENSSPAFSPRAYGLKVCGGLLLEQEGQPSCLLRIQATTKFSDWRWLGMCCTGNANITSAALLLVGGSEYRSFPDLDKNTSTQPHRLNPKELNT